MIEHIQIRGLSNLQTLQGVVSGEPDLGTFLGSIIPNDSTIKAALQALESEIETPTLLTLDDLVDVGYGESPDVGQILRWNGTIWQNADNIGSNVTLDTTNFTQNLSALENTVQKAFDKLDELAAGSTASAITTTTTSFNGILSASDNTVQKALDTLDNYSPTLTASATSTVTTAFNGILSAADNTVQKALDTLDNINYANGTAFSNHTSDATIHFTQSAISIPASQISDFDTEVSNNTSVSASTTHITSTGTDHSYINQSVKTTDSPSFVNATLSGKTLGSILFADTGGIISQDNSNFFWDNANKWLGIGGTPDAPLHIKSATAYDINGICKVENYNSGTGASTNSQFIQKNKYGSSQFMQWENNGVRIGSRVLTGGTGDVCFTAGADSEKIRILASNGYTGFGTTTPSEKLHLYGGNILVDNKSNGDTYLITGLQTSTGTNKAFGLRSDSNGQGVLELYMSGAKVIQFAGWSGNDSYINAGNFGVGTTTPAYLLDVNGITRVGDHGTASEDQVVNVCYGTSATPPTASTTTEGSLYVQYTA